MTRDSGRGTDADGTAAREVGLPGRYVIVHGMAEISSTSTTDQPSTAPSFLVDQLVQCFLARSLFDEQKPALEFTRLLLQTAAAQVEAEFYRGGETSDDQLGSGAGKPSRGGGGGGGGGGGDDDDNECEATLTISPGVCVGRCSNANARAIRTRTFAALRSLADGIIHSHVLFELCRAAKHGNLAKACAACLEQARARELTSHVRHMSIGTCRLLAELSGLPSLLSLAEDGGAAWADVGRGLRQARIPTRVPRYISTGDV